MTDIERNVSQWGLPISFTTMRWSAAGAKEGIFSVVHVSTLSRGVVITSVASPSLSAAAGRVIWDRGVLGTGDGFMPPVVELWLR